MRKNKTSADDQLVMESAINYIHAETPDFIFIHLEHTDEVGHEKGFMSAPYLQQVERADHAIGQLLGFLEKSSLEDEYTCLLTSDHGGHGHNHDGTVIEDFIIPWMVMGPSIRKNYTIESTVSILDTAPTLARIMRLPMLDFWEGEVMEEIFSDPRLLNSGRTEQIGVGENILNSDSGVNERKSIRKSA